MNDQANAAELLRERIVAPSNFRDEGAIRLLDIFGSLLLLVLASPVLLLLMLAVKLTSRGPAHYRGERVGRFGKPFTMYKLRTMAMGAEAQIGGRLVDPQEGLVIPWLHLVRQYRLDELPQLWNVLRGDMSLVGPRPIRPVFLEKHLNEIPRYANRFLVPQGVTGMAQVWSNYYRVPRDRVRYDLLYVRNRSFGLNVRVLALTAIRLGGRHLTAAMVAAWTLLLLLFVPPSWIAAARVPFGSINVNLLYLTPVIAGIWVVLQKSISGNRVELVRTPVDKLLAFFAGLAGLTALSSYQVQGALTGAIYYAVTGLTVFYLMANSRLAACLLPRTIVGAIGVGLVAALSTIGYALTGSSSHNIFFEARVEQPRVVAGFLAFAAPIALSFGVSREAGGAERRVAWIALAPLIAALLVAGSTVAQAAAFVGCAIVAALRRPVALVGFLALVVVMLALPVTRNVMGERGNHVRDAFIEETNQGMGALRTLSWQRALLGTGPRMLTPYLKGLVPGRTQHEAVAMTPRTTFWRLLLENGIVGFATWLAAVGVLLGHLFADARRNHHATALLGGTLALVMTFLAFDASQHLGIQVLFWSALGLAAGIHAGRDGTPAVYRILRARDAL